MHIPVELLWGILASIGAVALVLLAKLLFKLHSIVSRIEGLLINNEKNIDDSVEQIPKILKNIEEITNTTNEELKNVQEKIHEVESKLTDVAATAQNVADNFVMPAREILGLVSIARKFFKKKKKKLW